MTHSSMYQLQGELRQRVYDLNKEWHYHTHQATQVAAQRDHKQKQLDTLTEQIEKAEAYDREQYEKSQEAESEV